MDAMTGPKDLELPNSVGIGVTAQEDVRRRYTSPWRMYEKTYQLRLGVGDWVTVAERRRPLSTTSAEGKRQDPLSNLIIVRKLSGPDFADKLRKFEVIRHTNFVSALEIFLFEGSSYVISEYMSIFTFLYRRQSLP